MGELKDVLEMLKQMDRKVSAMDLLDEAIKEDKFKSLRRISPEQLRYFLDEHNKKYAN